MRVRRRFYSAVAALTILGLLTTAPDAVAAGKKSPMIVVLDRDADVDAAVKRGKGDHGVKPTNVFKHAARGYAAELNPGQVRAIERDRAVIGVIPDSVVELVAQVTPPGVRRVRATSSPLTHINGVDLASHRVNADVAIIDTGIQPNHPDLRVVGGYDCTRPGTRSERSQSSRWRDDHGHGTHVAGIVGALDNTRGVVGVAPGVRLWSVRVFTSTGYSRLSWIACGIDWVTSKRDPNNSARPLIEVANMSLRDKGTDDRNCGYSVIDIEHQAICRSTARGTLYVVAAGNDSNVAGNWRPASYNEVVTVSAMADYDGKPGGLASAPCVAFGRRDSDDTFADFSNYGLDIDVVAPGVCVRSTYRGSTYATISGTSMATPHVAGAAALFLVAHPGTTPADVRAAIRAAGLFDWRTSSDRDSIVDPLLDVSSFGAGPGLRLRSSTTSVGLRSGTGSAAVKLRLTRLDGLADTATLAAENLPAGVTATFSPASFSRWQFGVTTVTLRAAADADVGETDIVLVAKVGSIRGTHKLHVRIVD